MRLQPTHVMPLEAACPFRLALPFCTSPEIDPVVMSVFAISRTGLLKLNERNQNWLLMLREKLNF